MQKLEKTAAAWALTAWRLSNGVAVYRSPDGWTEQFPEAEIFRSRTGADQALAAASADGRVVVAPYLFEVALDAERARPASVRERMRAGVFHAEIGNQKSEIGSRNASVSDFRFPISGF